ncbi:MAG: glycosyltransferase family 4 protein [Proteobacteria bacterium]|nr:glycosyltransferase family 4 protein [Pseudomonadota bacterium]
MRILSLSYEYPPIGGGGAPMCQGLSEAMVAAGHEVDVVTSGMKGLPALEERRGVKIHRVRCLRRHRHYATTPELLTTLVPLYRKALALHRERAYDINHCHFAVPSGVPSYWLHRRTGLPYVITCHGSDIPGYNPDRFQWEHHLIRPVWSSIVRGAAALTCASRFLTDLIHQRLDVPVDVIPYGFDPPVFTDAPRRDRILTATRMFERKGVQFLVRALQHLDTHFEVWIAGGGPYLPELERLAAKLGVAVRFLGQVPHEELMQLYATTKIFVFTSAAENFPMVLLESLSAGCAVVTTDTSGCREVAEDAAVMVPPEDPMALASALSALLEDEARIAQLGELARERVARFRWSRVAGEYEALYHRCLGDTTLNRTAETR